MVVFRDGVGDHVRLGDFLLFVPNTHFFHDSGFSNVKLPQISTVFNFFVIPFPYIFSDKKVKTIFVKIRRDSKYFGRFIDRKWRSDDERVTGIV